MLCFVGAQTERERLGKHCDRRFYLRLFGLWQKKTRIVGFFLSVLSFPFSTQQNNYVYVLEKKKLCIMYVCISSASFPHTFLYDGVYTVQ